MSDDNNDNLIPPNLVFYQYVETLPLSVLGSPL